MPLSASPLFTYASPNAISKLGLPGDCLTADSSTTNASVLLSAASRRLLRFSAASRFLGSTFSSFLHSRMHSSLRFKYIASDRRTLIGLDVVRRDLLFLLELGERVVELPARPQR